MDTECAGTLTESAEILSVQWISTRGSYLDGKRLSKRVVVAFINVDCVVMRKLRLLRRLVLCDWHEWSGDE
jgi:hypothetical protein